MRLLILALLLTVTSAGAQDLKEMPKPQLGDKTTTDLRPADSTSTSPAAKDDAAKRLIARGWNQLKQGNPAAAIRSFNQSSSIAPVSAEAYRGLGAATSMQGKHDASVVLLEIASSLEPQNARLAADTGLEYIRYAISSSPSEQAERIKRFENADMWIKKAENIDPAMNQADAKQALALARAGEYAKALPYFKRAESLSRGDADAKLKLPASEPQKSAQAVSAGKEQEKAPQEMATAPIVTQTAASPAQPALAMATATSEAQPGSMATQASAHQEQAATSLAQASGPVEKLGVTPDTAAASPASAAQASAEPVKAAIKTAAAPAPAIASSTDAKESPEAANSQAVVQTSAVASQPAVQEAALPPAKTETPPNGNAEHQSGKKLRIVGRPSAYKGKDMRYCLSQSTNEAIMRCVYPRK